MNFDEKPRRYLVTPRPTFTPI